MAGIGLLAQGGTGLWCDGGSACQPSRGVRWADCRADEVLVPEAAGAADWMALTAGVLPPITIHEVSHCNQLLMTVMCWWCSDVT